MITNDLIIKTVEDHLIQTLININVKYPDIFTSENLKTWKNNINVFTTTIDEKTKIILERAAHQCPVHRSISKKVKKNIVFRYFQ